MFAKDFLHSKAEKRKLSMVTCYDYTFARLLSQTPIDAIPRMNPMTVVRGNLTRFRTGLSFSIANNDLHRPSTKSHVHPESRQGQTLP